MSLAMKKPSLSEIRRCYVCNMPKEKKAHAKEETKKAKSATLSEV